MNKIISEIVRKTNLSQQEAWWILEASTKKSKEELLCSTSPLTDQEKQQLERWIQEIIQEHKPLAYIIGFVPFLDLHIHVQPPTLIPRPETEEWVAHVIDMIHASDIKNPTIVDIGTGSGCIALAIAHAFPQAQVYALDIAESAIKLAQKNAIANGITNVTFIQSNIFQSVPESLTVDLIVSNPPYIPQSAQLERSVTDWEDHQALFAENNGTAIIQKIISQSAMKLKANQLPSQIILEVDISHINEVQQILEKNKFYNIHIHQDLFKNERTVWAKLHP